MGSSVREGMKMYDPTLLQLFYNATLCYLYSGGGGREDGGREGRREGGRGRMWANNIISLAI